MQFFSSVFYLSCIIYQQKNIKFKVFFEFFFMREAQPGEMWRKKKLIKIPHDNTVCDDNDLLIGMLAMAMQMNTHSRLLIYGWKWDEIFDR